MGNRANIYMEMPTKGSAPAGVYLYTHWSGDEWPEALREALLFGVSQWGDDQYLARIITSRVFSNIADDVLGGGLSLSIGDNGHPIIVADLINQQVSFADEGEETNPDKRYGHVSFADYVEQARAEYAKRKES